MGEKYNVWLYRLRKSKEKVWKNIWYKTNIMSTGKFLNVK